MALLLSDSAASPLLSHLKDEEKPFQRLRFEADVLAAKQDRTRLVDRNEHGRDMDLWAELVRFRQRVDGFRGTEEIFRAMRERELDLPTEGPAADVLWEHFISAGCRRAVFLVEVLDYAKETQLRTRHPYRHLFRLTICWFLRHQPYETMRWYKVLEDYGLIHNTPVQLLLEDTILSIEPKTARWAFRMIYEASSARDLYDECISLLIRHGKSFEVAYTWHDLLVPYDDLPTAAMRDNPVVRSLFLYKKTETRMHPKKRLKLLAAYNSSSRNFAKAQDELIYSREKANTMVGDVYGIKQKTLSDQFCARLFATGALPLDFIIGGVHMFGLDALGPLSLREIATRSRTLEDFLTTLRSAQDVGLLISGSNFSRALRIFASHGRQTQFELLCRSDRHPEDYDDPAILRQLFETSIRLERMDEAYMILEVLSISTADPSSFQWNILLQSCCQPTEFGRLSKVLRDMKTAGAVVSDESISIIRRRCLRRRRRGLRPVASDDHSWPVHDDLRFVTNLFLSIMGAGNDVHPSHWREILKRYGMTSRLDRLGSLCIRLANHYLAAGKNARSIGEAALLSHGSLESVPVTASVKHALHPLRLLFSEHFQRALVAWTFKSHKARSSPREDRTGYRNQLLVGCRRPLVSRAWLEGLAVLRELSRLGVPILQGAIRKEVRRRLLVFYGPSRPGSRENLLSRRANRLSLTYRMKLIQETWGGQGLFSLDDSAFTDGSPAEVEARLFRHLIGQGGRKHAQRGLNHGTHFRAISLGS